MTMLGRGEPFLRVSKKVLLKDSHLLPRSPGPRSDQEARTLRNQTCRRRPCAWLHRDPRGGWREVDTDLIWKICPL